MSSPVILWSSHGLRLGALYMYLLRYVQNGQLRERAEDSSFDSAPTRAEMTGNLVGDGDGGVIPAPHLSYLPYRVCRYIW